MKKEEPNSVIDDKLKWHFFNLYCMAVSDANFDARELQTLYAIGIERGISPETINQVVVTTGIAPAVPDSLEEKVTYLYDLTRMAWADGVIEEEEKAMLKKYIRYFGFKAENVEGILQYFLTKVKEGEKIENIINELQQ